MTVPVAVALVGAFGRMGLEIARAASAFPGVRIVAALERGDCPALGKDLGLASGISKMGLPIGSNLSEGIGKADVVVDLSLREATIEVAAAAASEGKALVCGTTGLGKDEISALEEASRKVPVLHTPNLSPGIAVMTALLEQAVKALGDEYDIEIVEIHHRNKVDAPSGTALALARAAGSAADMDPDEALVFGRHGETGVRPTNSIGVHAVRGGGVFGEHTAVLAGEHERLEITHRAGSRALFATGALRAAVFVCGVGPGLYTMADMLGLKDQPPKS